jgi:GT2 family glycosyltransferase
VLNYNGREDTLRCLSSLRATRYPNFQVTLVDQNSQDGTADEVARRFPWVRLVRNPVNNGFCAGNNQILRQSTAQYCVLLNNDTEQEPDWLDHLVEVAESDSRIAALQPKVRSLRDRTKFDYAGAAGGFIDIYGYPQCRGRIFDAVEEDRGQYDDLRRVFWCCGVAMFLRREVLDRVGFLDEGMFSYAEETDLSWRLNLAGYHQYVVPRSVIYHVGSGAWGQRRLQARKEYLLHRNHWIILFKNYAPATWPRIFPMKLLLEAMAFLRFLAGQPSRSWAILKANGWILGHLPVLWRQNREIMKLRRHSDAAIMRRMIRTSIAWHFFVRRNKRTFDQFIPYIRDY